MKKGILFFDVDGTLVDSGHRKMVPDVEVLEAIQKVRHNGYYCMISSGRNMAGLSMLESTDFDGFVFSDGAGIKLSEEESEVIPFDHDVLSSALNELMNEYGCDINACWENGSFVNQGTLDRFHNMMSESTDKITIQKVMAEQNVSLLENWKEEKILEVDIFFPDINTKKNWMKKKPGELEFVDMEDCYGEITVRNVSKASGCERMCRKLGIPVSKSFAFGDSMNDEAMLETCGKAIVMGNGDERLKKKADFVTGRIDEGGLIQAFRHYALL